MDNILVFKLYNQSINVLINSTISITKQIRMLNLLDIAHKILEDRENKLTYFLMIKA